MSTTVPEDDEDVPPIPLWRRTYVRIIVALLVGLIVALIFRGNPPKPVEQEKTTQDFIADVVPYQPVAREDKPPSAPEPPPPPPPITAPVQPVAAVAPPPPPPVAVPPAPPLPRMPQVATNQAPDELPIMSYKTVPPPLPAAAPADPPRTQLAFKAATINGVKASPAMDTTYMLMPGLVIAELDSAINSDQPGPIAAHLPYPVYSDKGVLLMEAGTRIMGNYVSVSSAGQTRLQATSVTAITPHGVFVPLGGPMADELGRAGLPGTIDHRYLERFGAATLMLLTESGLNIVQASVQKSGNSYLNFSSGGSGVSNLADEILRQQINIPPLFTKNQGDWIAIWVTEPVDFSDSYKVTGASSK